MVDAESRRIARDLITIFFSGKISNDEFLDDFPAGSKDRAIRAIYVKLWDFADDMFTHAFSGTLDEETAALVDRCVVFLDSPSEYEWSSWWMKLTKASRSESGDSSVWPFLR